MSLINIISASNPLKKNIPYIFGNALAIELTIQREDNSQPIDLSNSAFEFEILLHQTIPTDFDLVFVNNMFIVGNSGVGINDKVTLIASGSDLSDLKPIKYYYRFNHIDSTGYKSTWMCGRLEVGKKC